MICCDVCNWCKRPFFKHSTLRTSMEWHPNNKYMCYVRNWCWICRHRASYLIQLIAFVFGVGLKQIRSSAFISLFFYFENSFATCSKSTRRNENVNHIFFFVCDIEFVFLFNSLYRLEVFLFLINVYIHFDKTVRFDQLWYYPLNFKQLQFKW